MNDTALLNVKRENVRSIYSAIAAVEKISRRELAKRTSLSLMTVGKVVDTMIELDIADETKSSPGNAGRRAGLLSLKNSKYALIVDLTSLDFVLYIMDAKNHICDHYIYSYDFHIRHSDNLSLFLKRIGSYVNRRVNTDLCIGCAAVVTGNYDSAADRITDSEISEMNDIKPYKLLCSCFPFCPVIISSTENTAGDYLFSRVAKPSAQSLFYINIRRNRVTSGLIFRDTPAVFRHYQRAGQMLVSDAPLEERIANSSSPEAAAYYAAMFIHNVCCVACPDVIVIEAPAFRNSSDYVDMIKDELDRRLTPVSCALPDIICCGGDSPVLCGLCSKTHEMWLEKTLFGTTGKIGENS